MRRCSAIAHGNLVEMWRSAERSPWVENFDPGRFEIGYITRDHVDADSYLMELARYVVLNPVRAYMVEKPEDWPWSSYRAMGNQRLAPDWLEVDGVLAYFGPNRRTAVAAYRRFVHEGIGKDGPWRHLRSQVYLGDEQFLEAMQEKLDEQIGSIETPQAQRRPRAMPLEHYESRASRDDAICAAYDSGGYTLQAIAKHFGVHYSTVSRIVNRKYPK